MPVQDCCVSNCNSKRYRGSRSITFHCFPTRDPVRMEQWITWVNRQTSDSKPWIPSKLDKVCSEHFLPSDFNNGYGYKTLVSTAVPSLFPSYSTHGEQCSLETKSLFQSTTSDRIKDILQIEFANRNNSSSYAPVKDNLSPIRQNVSKSCTDIDVSKRPPGQNKTKSPPGQNVSKSPTIQSVSRSPIEQNKSVNTETLKGQPSYLHFEKDIDWQPSNKLQLERKKRKPDHTLLNISDMQINTSRTSRKKRKTVDIGSKLEQGTELSASLDFKTAEISKDELPLNEDSKNAQQCLLLEEASFHQCNPNNSKPSISSMNSAKNNENFMTMRLFSDGTCDTFVVQTNDYESGESSGCEEHCTDIDPEDCQAAHSSGGNKESIKPVMLIKTADMKKLQPKQLPMMPFEESEDKHEVKVEIDIDSSIQESETGLHTFDSQETTVSSCSVLPLMKETSLAAITESSTLTLSKKIEMASLSTPSGVKPEKLKCFQNKPLSNNRVANNSDSSKQFPCVVCGHVCSNYLSLSEHMKQHEARNDVYFVCCFCGNHFKSVKDFSHHHFFVKCCPYTCELCNKKFQLKNKLLQHICNAHKKQPKDYLGSVKLKG